MINCGCGVGCLDASSLFCLTDPNGWEMEDECGTSGAGDVHVCGSAFCMQKCTCSRAS